MCVLAFATWRCILDLSTENFIEPESRTHTDIPYGSNRIGKKFFSTQYQSSPKPYRFGTDFLTDHMFADLVLTRLTVSRSEYEHAC